MKNKILITGTGRSGTSLLVKLFSHLGMDTGFTGKQANNQTNNKHNAGLEILDLSVNIRIHKAPHFSEMIDDIVKDYDIDHVIIPIRDLYKSAKSREINGGKNTPGGLWKSNNLEEQITHNAKLFYKLIYDLTKNDIKYTIIQFPKMVKEIDLLYNSLFWLFEEYKIDKETYEKVFNNIIDLKKIKL
jgi:hypothetical protein